MSTISGLPPSSPNQPLDPNAGVSKAEITKPTSTPVASPSLTLSNTTVSSSPSPTFRLSLPSPIFSGGESLQGLLMKLQVDLERIGFATKEREAQTNLDSIEHKLRTYEAFQLRALATAERIRQADEIIASYPESIKAALPGERAEESRLKGEVNKAKGLVKEADGLVQKLEGDLQKAEKDLAKNREERRELTAGVTSAEQKVERLRSDLANLPTDSKFDKERRGLADQLRKAEGSLGAAREKLAKLPPESKFTDARDRIAGDLTRSREDAASARDRLGLAEGAYNAQGEHVRSLENRLKAIGGPGWEGSLLQSQLRLTAMATQGSSLTTGQIHDLLGQTRESGLPVDAMRRLGWEAGALALERAASGVGQILTGREVANLLDLGERNHPVDTAFELIKFDFSSNEKIRQQVNAALFRQEDADGAKVTADLEEQISLVLQMLMARWAGDAGREEELDRQFARKLSI